MRCRFILIVIVLIMISGLFCGCQRFVSDMKDSLENSQSGVGGEMGLEIIRCLSDKESEALKDMFCLRIKNSHDLDEEIKYAFSIIDSSIISHDTFQIGGQESWREGDKVRSYIGSTIDNVTLSNDEKYSIFFSAYIVNNKHNDLIGVTCIDIYNNDHELICSVGEQI